MYPGIIVCSFSVPLQATLWLGQESCDTHQLAQKVTHKMNHRDSDKAEGENTFLLFTPPSFVLRVEVTLGAAWAHHEVLAAPFFSIFPTRNKCKTSRGQAAGTHSQASPFSESTEPWVFWPQKSVL